uniref:Uncharacterized protein n=1 Tax=Anopheles albimanus TaxID=7167 RepID=A0A182FZ47_ANOAL
MYNNGVDDTLAINGVNAIFGLMGVEHTFYEEINFVLSTTDNYRK